MFLYITRTLTKLNIVMEIKSLQIKLFFFCASTLYLSEDDSEMYQPFSRWELSLIDIDECTTNRHNCDISAFCNNTEGSHNCTCKPGYSGDGSNCTGNDVF